MSDLPFPVSDFICRLSMVNFLSPDCNAPVPSWMHIGPPISLEVISSETKARRNREREFLAARAVLGESREWYETVDVAFDTARKIMQGLSAHNAYAVWDASECTAWYACGLLVEDKGVDITWLRRWWEAWRLGYYPIREDGDVLVVAEVKR